ncbi:MAG: hypothetical protein ONB46_06835 [candidate division KSB1 bacterium]|nr:hypothetical protein [candidate division KSB1 bacterium]MDZ7367181.1 hypothetical protein [candidate division KSB1 bacterium]MDZ7405336.1 hypothetical protein [candidate division KSB1 bacterium]
MNEAILDQTQVIRAAEEMSIAAKVKTAHDMAREYRILWSLKGFSAHVKTRNNFPDGARHGRIYLHRL